MNPGAREAIFRSVRRIFFGTLLALCAVGLFCSVGGLVSVFFCLCGRSEHWQAHALLGLLFILKGLVFAAQARLFWRALNAR